MKKQSCLFLGGWRTSNTWGGRKKQIYKAAFEPSSGKDSGDLPHWDEKKLYLICTVSIGLIMPLVFFLWWAFCYLWAFEAGGMFLYFCLKQGLSNLLIISVTNALACRRVYYLLSKSCLIHGHVWFHAHITSLPFHACTSKIHATVILVFVVELFIWVLVWYRVT